MNMDFSSVFTATNNIFFIVIALCLVFGIMRGEIGRGQLVSSLPGVAISLGILGTFYGIFVGLMGFDEAHISESIPELLRGMKTAFATSLAGMSTSIILKFYYSWSDDKSVKASNDPVTSLRRIEDAIVSCFKSDEEYSLVSQVKLIRQELIDSRRETKQAFKEFADEFSKIASASLVDELQKVVNDFNAMLNELVSESFKELSSAMISLNDWQQQYRISIEENQENLKDSYSKMKQLHDTFENVVDRLVQLDGTFESIDQSLTAISVSGAELDEHTKAIASQNMLLESAIKSVRDMGQEASKVVPEISAKMNKIVNEIQVLQTETNDFVGRTTEELSDGFKQLSTEVQNHTKAIEKSLEEELTKSLNSLAGSLSALSGKFASDYLPLTEKLRDVLSIAEGGNGRMG
ncbi:MotA/TolQ/ExbB proton channel family protein [Desulfovibrio ferrophilus]|uniref:MotA/TolQ/ExbB proton channel domain-containing protein n=1 Tax=Desulfovibrio ferrophilus TaxID=241368 RepID=A0A2Z6B1Z5_9BACT|nr:MotA/TolQ/ExbB proton channel family protein [Desulfovibrio ferrophilus]BBD09537.1 uncharacterized protein DFE_2811 [Desulfovibrio ferrophilus]